MHDLVGAYERMSRVYRMFIESIFPLRYPALVQERRKLLDAVGLLSQPPLLEPVPLYPSAGANLEKTAADLAAAAKKAGLTDLECGLPDLPRLAVGRVVGDRLVSGLMGPNDEPYRHQRRALEAVLLEGRDIVVTTGTGSGKTECFLLP